MSASGRVSLALFAALTSVLAAGCVQETADVRAPRAYNGAPPVIPHEAFGAPCRSCHGDGAPEIRVDERGTAPSSPHGETPGMSASRCQQCHVFQLDAGTFRASGFVPLAPPGLPSPRAHALAPPPMPHRTFMREDCLSCHSGAGARDSIRTTHPERTRCRQCHVAQDVETPWARS